MYELVKVSSQSYYIECPAKIGIYVNNNNEAYLIDSGSDKDAGRKVRQILDKNNWILKAILNTHSHADHIGGNHYLQTQTGCSIFSNSIETEFTQHTILEPSFLYGGFPCKDLKHKFLMAQESEVLNFKDTAFPKEIEIIQLPGHSFNMVGFRTPDNVVYLADCISSIETLNKYGIPFIYDVESFLKTLDKVEALEANLFIPSHSEACSNVSEIIKFNRNKILEISENIISVCKTGISFENILKEIFNLYGITMNFQQYALVGSSIRSFLSWLKDGGKIDIYFKDNKMLWLSK